MMKGNEMENIICIYHGNCADGFTAAWAVWKRFPNAEFHAGVYGEDPPDVSQKRVILVDFSYKPDVLREMSRKAESMLILDHHKSAMEEIKNYEMIENGKKCQLFVNMFQEYSGPLTWDRHIQNAYQDYCEGIPRALIYTVLDMNRSGARIAWDFFHPDNLVPQLVLHVEDRDLWRFELEKTREIQSYVFSHEYTFDNWDFLAGMCDDPEGYKEIASAGAAIERKHFKDVAELIKVSKRRMFIGGHEVYVVNLPYTMASDACHALCKETMYPSGSGELNTTPPFGASYWDGHNGRTFSLRSIGNFDVSEVARKYGGGGHKNAAGFKVPIGWEGD